MFVYRIDEEVSLKLAEPKDAPLLFEVTDASRDHLRQWLPWLDFTKTEQDTLAFIQGALKGYAENRSMTAVILYHNEIVGCASYNSIDWTNKIAHIGYWLGQDYQGRGIITRVAGALTDYAIKELKLNRVEIRAAVGNKKSRSIPERLGYIYEGCVRESEWLYDHYVDHAIYGMLARDWNKEAVKPQ
ncbi:MAG: GNAT family N-acetyltransferase [Bacillus sp. (in: firmicutes)]